MYRTTLLTFLFVAAAGSVPVAAQPVTLEAAVQRAVNRIEEEDTGVTLAEGRLRHLENLGRLRIGFRPQFGLLSFSNPAMLAAALGGGITFGRQSAPSKFDLLSARLDVLEAELARERQKVQAELQTVRLFFGVLASQQVAAKACEATSGAGTRLEKVHALVAASRLTQLDAIQYEISALDAESRCVQAEADRRGAALRLAAATGDTAVDLTVADVDLPGGLTESALASFDSMLAPAFLARPAAASIRARAGEIAQDTIPSRALRFEFFSPSFATNGGPGGASGAVFSGARMLRGEAGIEYFFGAKADGEAQRQIVAARLARLEHSLEATQTEIRTEIETSAEQARAALARERISRRKLELVRHARSAVGKRMEAGLASVASGFPVEEIEVGVQSEHAHALSDLKSGLYSVAFVSGVEGQASQRLAELLEKRTTAWRESAR